LTIINVFKAGFVRASKEEIVGRTLSRREYLFMDSDYFKFFHHITEEGKV